MSIENTNLDFSPNLLCLADNSACQWIQNDSRVKLTGKIIIIINFEKCEAYKKIKEMPIIKPR